MLGKKVALIGAGHIGGVGALLCILRRAGAVVLYDNAVGLPQGKGLDLAHAAAVLGYDCDVHGSNQISDIKGADVCIVTAGFPRGPGMSRDDLLRTNARVFIEVAAGLREFAQGALVIVVTNPLDAMAYLMQRETGFPTRLVVGMGGMLDSARYRSFLSEKAGAPVSTVSALVLGAHGDEMVPVRSHSAIADVPVADGLAAVQLEELDRRVRGAGAEIISLLKSGSSSFSPATAAVMLAESYLADQKKVLPVSAWCDGEYGIRGLYFGVPAVVGAGGVEKIVELELSSAERAGLQRGCEATEKLIGTLPKNKN